MSGTSSAIDTMSPEDTALMESMRDDTGAPETVETAPAPAADEAPDLEAEDTADEPAERIPGKPVTVPLRKLRAEEERRKTAETERATALQELAVQKGVVAERMRILTEAVQASVPPAATAPAAEIVIPDVETDPVGHVKALLAQEQKQRQNLEAIVNGFQESQKQGQAVAQLRNWVVSQENDFAATEPTYHAATKFLIDGRNAELEAIGVAPEERAGVLMNDMTQLALKARQDGVNFGERVFNLAKSRGFTKPATAPVVPPIDTEAPLPDRAARIEAGRANSTTIASAGSPAPLALTPEKIGNMSDAQFAAYVKKIEGNPAAIRDLMGH